MSIYYGFTQELPTWLEVAARLNGSKIPSIECEHSGTCKMKKTWKFGYDGVVPMVDHLMSKSVSRKSKQKREKNGVYRLVV